MNGEISMLCPRCRLTYLADRDTLYDFYGTDSVLRSVGDPAEALLLPCEDCSGPAEWAQADLLKKMGDHLQLKTLDLKALPLKLKKGHADGLRDTALDWFDLRAAMYVHGLDFDLPEDIYEWIPP